MARALLLVASLCTAYAMRSREKESQFEPEYEATLRKYTDEMIHEVEEVDSKLPAHDDHVVPLLAEVQVAETLHDIGGLSNLTFTMSVERESPGFEARLRVTNRSLAAALVSAMRRVANASLPPSLGSLVKISSSSRWHHEEITITVGPFQMPPPAAAALETFVAHFGHLEFSEYQDVDWKKVMSNLTEDTNILEKFFFGMRYVLNATLTTGLEHAIGNVVKAHREPEYERAHEYDAVNVSWVDPYTRTYTGEMITRRYLTCQARESPCSTSSEGDCCDTSVCLIDKEIQCSHNFSACIPYCVHSAEDPSIIGTVVQKLGGLFTGAFASVRAAYDEETRKELIHMLPLLGMRYSDITQQYASVFHRLPAQFLGSPSALALAELVNVLDGIDSIDSLELTGLPVKAKVTMSSSSSPFPLLAKFLKDAQLVETLRNHSIVKGVNETNYTGSNVSA
ncbi:unnamed protein product [Effrenium voratum]|uniref:Uncharacterized protein n=1 Tax=Effrenium voratum TaxID=2562239 RepID=A0AA36MSA6_9DINO|nr:unnamed protein product [Effrenium voratum]CAJ1431454.1 unnamed protein product [Effrenium voratum]